MMGLLVRSAPLATGLLASAALWCRRCMQGAHVAVYDVEHACLGVLDVLSRTAVSTQLFLARSAGGQATQTAHAAMRKHVADNASITHVDGQAAA